MTDGVIITFDDGTFALYSSALLYENLGRAERFAESMYADDDLPPEQKQE